MKRVSLIILAFIIGCASTMHNPGVDQNSAYRFSVEIPDGWRKLDTNKYLLITKDGPLLQYALVQQRPVDRPFRHTKKYLKREMLPQEAADIIIDEISLDRHITNFTIIENAPAVIDGHEGFKILFTFKDKDGSTFKTLYYGFIREDWFYNLRYNAAMRHYFEKDIATFEQILSSFRIVGDKRI